MTNAYCSVSIQPGKTGELRPATCCSKIDGQDLVVTTNWARGAYDALRRTVEIVLRWSAKNQPLKIHVADTAILSNRDLRRLCRKTGSQIVIGESAPLRPTAPHSGELIVDVRGSA
jgi:hypothetical protein